MKQDYQLWKEKKMEGWIKVHRKILDNPIIERPLWCWLWVYLLLKANHEDKKFIFNNQDIVINRGQLLTGRKQLVKETHITDQTIRSALAYLKSTKQVTINSTNKYSIITINNYNAYQEVTSKVTNQQPASNQQATTNKNDKNVKNDKNIKKREYEPMADEKWKKFKEEIYRKVGKSL